MFTEHITQHLIDWLSVAQGHSKDYFSYIPDKDMFTQQKKKPNKRLIICRSNVTISITADKNGLTEHLQQHTE